MRPIKPHLAVKGSEPDAGVVIARSPADGGITETPVHQPTPSPPAAGNIDPMVMTSQQPNGV